MAALNFHSPEKFRTTSQELKISVYRMDLPPGARLTITSHPFNTMFSNGPDALFMSDPMLNPQEVVVGMSDTCGADNGWYQFSVPDLGGVVARLHIPAPPDCMAACSPMSPDCERCMNAADRKFGIQVRSQPPLDRACCAVDVRGE